MKLAYCSPYVPAEWIAAHGLTPVFYRPSGDEREGPVQNRAGTCAFMRAFINEAANEKEIDALIVTTVCDQMRRSVDLLENRCLKPFFMMNVPATWQTAAAFDYYMQELGRLSRFLVGLGGEIPSNEKLAFTMKAFEGGRSAMLADASLQKGDELTGALRSLFETGALPTPKRTKLSGIPIAVVGGPLTIRDLAIFKTIEDMGGAIVLDGTENGERMLPAAFNRRELADDPLGTLANAYFLGIPDVCKRPNSEIFSWLKKEIHSRNVKGVVLVRYVFCDCWHAEVTRLAEWLEVPTVDIDFTGEGAGIRNATRVAAFMEALH